MKKLLGSAFFGSALFVTLLACNASARLYDGPVLNTPGAGASTTSATMGLSGSFNFGTSTAPIGNRTVYLVISGTGGIVGTYGINMATGVFSGRVTASEFAGDGSNLTGISNVAGGQTIYIYDQNNSFLGIVGTMTFLGTNVTVEYASGGSTVTISDDGYSIFKDSFQVTGAYISSMTVKGTITTSDSIKAGENNILGTTYISSLNVIGTMVSTSGISVSSVTSNFVSIPNYFNLVIPQGVAIGYNALNQNNALGNTAFGYGALSLVSTRENNTAVGTYALKYSSTASNTAVGYRASMNLGTGNNNTAFGSQALYTNISGSGSVSIGMNSMISNLNGSYNTALGLQAGYNNQGTGNVFLGSNAGFSDVTNSNALYIANSSTNNLITGNFAISSVTVHGNLEVLSTVTATGLVGYGGGITGVIAGSYPSYDLSKSTTEARLDIATWTIPIDITNFIGLTTASYSTDVTVSSFGLFQFIVSSGNVVYFDVHFGTGIDTADPILDFVEWSTGTISAVSHYLIEIATGVSWAGTTYFTVSGAQMNNGTRRASTISLSGWKDLIGARDIDAKVKVILANNPVVRPFFRRATIYHNENKQMQ